MRSTAALALAVLVATSLAACGGHDDDHDHPDAAASGDGGGGDGGGGDAAATPRETVTRIVTLGAGASREGEVALVAAGDQVHVRATASAATLAWNVHTHDSGGTQILEEGNAVAAIDYVIEGTPGDYWLLLVNGTGSNTVEVNLDLYGQAQYTGGL